MQELKLNELANTPIKKKPLSEEEQADQLADQSAHESEAGVRVSNTPQGSDLPGPDNPFGAEGGRGVNTSNVQSGAGAGNKAVTAKP